MPETPRYKLPYPDYQKANDVPGDLQALAQRTESALPLVGAMFATFNKTAPSNCLIMRGQTVSRSAWPLLADLWGIPSNVLTFVIPDMTGCTVMGAASDAQVGTIDGANSRTISVNQLPSHGHTFTPNNIQLNDPGHQHLIDVAGAQLVIAPPTEEQRYMPNRYLQPPTSGSFIHTTMTPTLQPATTGITVNQATTGGTVNNTGGGQALDTTPKHIKLNWMVVAA